jgi:Integrase core domain
MLTLGTTGSSQHATPISTVAPFEFVFLDLIESLPETRAKNRHIITATDGFSKWLEAKAIAHKDSDSTSIFLIDQLVFRFGRPAIVITDGGPAFRGRFDETCRTLRIIHRTGSKYHPQTQGQDENSNGILVNRIRKLLEEGKTNHWDTFLSSAVYAVNSRTVSTIRRTPCEALFGFVGCTACGLGDKQTTI